MVRAIGFEAHDLRCVLPLIARTTCCGCVAADALGDSRFELYDIEWQRCVLRRGRCLQSDAAGIYRNEVFDG